MESVDSSSISAVGYDAERLRLYVEFHDDDTMYCYDDVPSEVHTSLMAAESKGAYHNRFVRHEFTAHPVPRLL